MTTTAIVFDIQRNSMEDGPGIRTTVFLKGCCMRCRWCHNPESFERSPQTVTLPNGRRRTYGEVMSVEEVFQFVEADVPFFSASGGGVTLSGGEPLLFPDFIKQLLQRCKQAGIHTAIETNGFPPWLNYAAVLDLTDLFLFDYKATPSERHIDLTGVPLEPVLERLEQLVNKGKAIILRCPIVPTVNDNVEHLKAIAELSRQYGVPIHIMPYHNTARDKWQALNFSYELEGLPSMSEHEAERIIEWIVTYGADEKLVRLP